MSRHGDVSPCPIAALGTPNPPCRTRISVLVLLRGWGHCPSYRGHAPSAPVPRWGHRSSSRGGSGDAHPPPCRTWGHQSSSHTWRCQTPPSHPPTITCSSGQHPHCPELSLQHVFPSGQLISSSHFTSPTADNAAAVTDIPNNVPNNVPSRGRGGGRGGRWRPLTARHVPHRGAHGALQVTRGALGTAVPPVAAAHGLRGDSAVTAWGGRHGGVTVGGSGGHTLTFCRGQQP